MERYIGTKIVQAEKMNYWDFMKKFKDIDYYENKAELAPENKEGYKVRYQDGYTSWSPEKPFEDAYTLIDNVKLLHNPLSSTNHSVIFKDTSSNNYVIRRTNDDSGVDLDRILTAIKFQEGPTKETEINGCFMEDLIHICINRLENFNSGEWACMENAHAIKKLYEAIFWLNARTKKRQAEGKYGTYQI